MEGEGERERAGGGREGGREKGGGRDEGRLGENEAGRKVGRGVGGIRTAYSALFYTNALHRKVRSGQPTDTLALLIPIKAGFLLRG